MDRKKITDFLIKIQDFLCEVFSAFRTKIESYSDAMLLLFLSGFYFVWRILSLPHFEYSGDAVYKWQILRYYYETGTWFPQVLDHHQGRWCQNLPVYGLMKLLGTTDPWVGCIVPVLTGFGVLLLVYLIARQIAPKTFALLSTLCVMLNNVFADESAQFLPDLPASFYTLLSLFLLLRYLKKPEKLYYPLLAGLTMGLAWGCKVTSVYWCIGIGLFLCFFPVPGKALFTWKRFRLGRDVILFSLAFFCVFAVEFAVLHQLFDAAKWGRISFLMGQYDASGVRCDERYNLNLIEYVFSPFFFLLDPHGKAWDTVPRMLLFLLSLPVIILLLRTKNLSLSAKFLAIVLTVTFLLHFYLVVHIFPFKHPQRPDLTRYMQTMTYVAFILLYPGWQMLLEKLKGKTALLHLSALYLCEILITVILVFDMMYFITRPILNGDNLCNKIRAYQCIREQKADDLPLLIPCTKRGEVNEDPVLAVQTFCAPAEDLPQLPERKKNGLPDLPKLKTANDNVCCSLVAGRCPQPGETVRCMVIRNERFIMTELTFSTESESK